MERLYQQMIDWLQAQGVKHQPALTPFEYIDHAKTTLPLLRSLPSYQVLNSIVNHYVEWRYGSVETDVTTLERSFLRLRRSAQQQALRSSWIKFPIKS